MLGVAALLCYCVIGTELSETSAPMEWSSVPGGDEDFPWLMSSGVAPGYLPDQACAECHGAIAESYQDLGMARAFFKLTAPKVVEDFVRNNHFFHAASGRHYQMQTRAGEYFISRWMEDDDGEAFGLREERIDWVLGSGNSSRSYLHQNELGELYQFPIVWYSKLNSWGMAPGYDRAHHQGFERRIGSRCMFCHNAYADMPEGSDAAGVAPRFPLELPQGIGCQRCHGPGAEHVKLALDPAVGDSELAAAIVNPGKLPAARLDDVCNQCHLQPSTQLDSHLQRLGRGSFSFRPGQVLADFRLGLVLPQFGDGSETFEVNHHSTRLRESACFENSSGALACIRCHDPHAKPAPEILAKRVREVCMGCHAGESMHDSLEDKPDESQADCAACHMPLHRAADAIQLLMTDHRIRRLPAPDDWTDPRPERNALPGTAQFYDETLVPVGDEGRILQAMAETVRGGGGSQRIAMKQLLEQSSLAFPESWSALGAAHMQAGETEQAIEAFSRARALAPQRDFLTIQLSEALRSAGQDRKALQLVRECIKHNPNNPDLLREMAEALSATGRKERALRFAENAVEQRDNHFAARMLLGSLHLEEGDAEAALEALNAAISIEPSAPEAHHDYAYVLALEDRWDEALRHWRLAAERAPASADLQRSLAIAALCAPSVEVRNSKLALRAARSAMELDGSHVDAQACLALAMCVTGEEAEGIAALKHALELSISGGPGELTIQLALAVAESDGSRAQAKSIRPLLVRSKGQAPLSLQTLLRRRLMRGN